jgi:hypothetical protein
LISLILLIGVNEVSQVQLNRQKSKKVHKITASPRLQSEEDLILNMQRKQEFKSMNQGHHVLWILELCGEIGPMKMLMKWLVQFLLGPE